MKIYQLVKIELEKMIRLHHELDVNVAGIEMESMQQEITALKNKLHFYSSTNER